MHRGFCGNVSAFFTTTEMAPVLAEYSALYGQRPPESSTDRGLRKINSSPSTHPVSSMLTQIHIHQFYELFLAQRTYGVTGICIIRKPVHEEVE